ncbi:hypothetical protein DPMN_020974 [Dreissena polymorpha]|uniref:Uncharacterized protein n=1 Tax=Dreissena polymorpha TaxID=45954 RepID=A0A9D4NHS6_DREPO|nr:hypothetical protein DPMN_020974 [Dreissena polymorpha]
MLLANVGAYGYFMMDGAYMSGLTMLASTTTLSSVMGVTLTMAIGGKWGSFVTSDFFCPKLQPILGCFPIAKNDVFFPKI